MTFEQFKANFDRLVKAFNISKPEDKSKVYFEELKNITGGLFASACTKIIRSQDRFPSISAILLIVSTVTPSERKERATCADCDGFGWVKIGLEMYRGDCHHGLELSNKIMVAPNKEDRSIEMINQKQRWSEWYGEGFWEKRINFFNKIT